MKKMRSKMSNKELAVILTAILLSVVGLAAGSILCEVYEADSPVFWIGALCSMSCGVFFVFLGRSLHEDGKKYSEE